MRARKSTFYGLGVALLAVLLFALVPAVLAAQHNPLYDVPNESGFMPCYIFDAGTWGGEQWLDLKQSEYDACDVYGGYLTVYCANDEGEWVNNTVHDVVYHTVPGGALSFDLTQGGHCGIFPTGETFVVDHVETMSQLIGEDNTLTVPQVIASQPGWIVIHAQGEGGPGAVIGYAHVSTGVNTDVKVPVDPADVTSTVYAMLHIDRGTAGLYEFPGSDVPVKDMNGNVVVVPFIIKA
jgi:hypothetical protein